MKDGKIVLTMSFLRSKFLIMKALFFILIIILSVSCSPENFWQKAGLAEPEPISISSKTGKADISEDENKVDVVKSFVGDRDSAIAFSIDKPSDFNGCILYPQSKNEAESMAQVLNAKCFGKEKVIEYLSSEIDDQDLVGAMKNTVFLLNKGKTTIIDCIVGFLPVFDVDSADEKTEEIIKYYNSLRESISRYCDDFISGLFDPLLSILSTSSTPTWGEYIKCQLMINLFSGVLEGMEKTVSEAVSLLSSEELNDYVFNLDETADKKELEENLEKVGVVALLNIVDGVVSSVLSPIAVYNSISYSYGKDIGLMSVSDIMSQLMGENK